MDTQYHELVITTANPGTSIWLADDRGNLVNRTRSVMQVSLEPGTYKVRFGLEGAVHDIELKENMEFHEED